MLTWILTGSPRSSTNPKAKSCWMLCGKKRWPNILLLESTTFWKASSTDDGRYRPVSASTLDYFSFSFPFSDMFTVSSFGFLSRHLLHFPGSTIRYPSIFTRIANLFSELAMTVSKRKSISGRYALGATTGCCFPACHGASYRPRGSLSCSNQVRRTQNQPTLAM